MYLKGLLSTGLGQGPCPTSFLEDCLQEALLPPSGHRQQKQLLSHWQDQHCCFTHRETEIQRKVKTGQETTLRQASDIRKIRYNPRSVLPTHGKKLKRLNCPLSLGMLTQAARFPAGHPCLSASDMDLARPGKHPLLLALFLLQTSSLLNHSPERAHPRRM